MAPLMLMHLLVLGPIAGHCGLWGLTVGSWIKKEKQNEMSHIVHQVAANQLYEGNLLFPLPPAFRTGEWLNQLIHPPSQ